ncbi:hypothetical protein QW060_13805 [Myroides ceti]|uniref:Uncharacterized protein n=1 Tax=Paenimyroides ceti TaxID=395087 RepID=A0ABT8CW03_9FLAO|nr:hypothetical protein [Paenimyroides ceti]MDN3708181.1 hypothetical protein [Paenimyroides ceti]
MTKQKTAARHYVAGKTDMADHTADLLMSGTRTEADPATGAEKPERADLQRQSDPYYRRRQHGSTV